MKINPVAAELFYVFWHTEGHDEANMHFSKFSEKRSKTINI